MKTILIGFIILFAFGCSVKTIPSSQAVKTAPPALIEVSKKKDPAIVEFEGIYVGAEIPQDKKMDCLEGYCTFSGTFAGLNAVWEAGLVSVKKDGNTRSYVYELSVDFMEGDFKSIRTALIKKYGPPTIEWKKDATWVKDSRTPMSLKVSGENREFTITHNGMADLELRNRSEKAKKERKRSINF